MGRIALRTAARRSCAYGFVTAVSVICLASCGSSQPSAKSHTSFNQLIQQGTSSLAQHHPSAAASAFRQAIHAKPNSPVGYYDLGVAYASTGQRKPSLTQYAKALSHDKNYVPALYNYGVAFMQTRPEVAMYFFRRVIQLHPDSPTALLNLGLLVHQTNPKASAHALRLLKAAAELQPSLYATLPPGLRAAVRATKLPKRTKRRKPGLR